MRAWSRKQSTWSDPGRDGCTADEVTFLSPYSRCPGTLNLVPEATEPPSAAELVLGSLLEAGHRLAPDEVVPTVAAHFAALGMIDLAVYLVDLDQRLLVPLAADSTPADRLDINATRPGLAFRTKEVLEEPAQAGTGTRLWAPLVDGADRLGVLGVTVAVADSDTVRRARNLASITAGLVVSKSTHGDHLVLARRTRDMDLAAEMRWSMLPPLTFTNDRVAVAGMLEPAYEIAGDAFDYAVNGDLAHLAIVDAMGHGLEASRMANLAVGSYRHSRRRGLDLAETFSTMDQVVAEQLGPERFITGQLARLDLASGGLKWVNAGGTHPRFSTVRVSRSTTSAVRRRCRWDSGTSWPRWPRSPSSRGTRFSS